MEYEINSADANEIRAQLAQLYASLNSGIDAQIAGAPQLPEDAPTNPLPRQAVQQILPPPPPVQLRNGYVNGRNRVATASTNGNGNARRVTATEAQVKCVYALTKALGMDLVSVLADYNVADPRDLHVRDCSRLIDQLKSQQNGAAH